MTTSILISPGLFFCILTDLKAVVWMVSNRSLISNSPSPLSEILETNPNARITIGVTTNLMFHSFFNFLERASTADLFNFNSVVRWDNKIYWTVILSYFLFVLWFVCFFGFLSFFVFFFFCWLSPSVVSGSGLGNPFIFPNPSEFYAFYSLKQIQVCLVCFGFFVWWHINVCRLFNAKAILLEEQ